MGHSQDTEGGYKDHKERVVWRNRFGNIQALLPSILGTTHLSVDMTKVLTLNYNCTATFLTKHS